ncbi:MAG: hypothetical protein GXP36_01475 [Actinobacteria bacterium]|nr:hypothetical protein [Actinomycetota bacterium]
MNEVSGGVAGSTDAVAGRVSLGAAPVIIEGTSASLARASEATPPLWIDSGGVDPLLDLFVSDVTVEAWVQTSSAGISGIQPIFATGGELGGGGFSAYISGSFVVAQVSYSDEGNTYLNDFLSAQVDINDGLPHYVAVTRDDLDVRLYVDGVEVASTATSGPIVYAREVSPLIDENVLVLGQAIFGDGGNGELDGRIDEVAVYDYALPASALATHFMAGSAAPAGEILLSVDTIELPAIDPTFNLQRLRVMDAFGQPAPGAELTFTTPEIFCFSLTDISSFLAPELCTTDVLGYAFFAYTGNGSAGTSDSFGITATLLPDGGQVTTNVDVVFYEPINLVGLGDSYSSGQSVAVQYGGACKRSTNAYAAQFRAPGYLQPISAYGPPSAGAPGFVFTACSSARLENISQVGQSEAEPSIPQLDVPGVDVLINMAAFTIGGNDLEWPSVLEICAAFPDCTGIQPGLESLIAQMGIDIGPVYAAIANDLAPDAAVFVLGYPNLLPAQEPNACGSFSRINAAFGNEEFQMFRDLGQQLDETLAQTAAQAGFHYISMLDLFEGHEACGDLDDWMGGMNLQGLSAADSAFHPNLLGQNAYRRALESYITSQLAAGDLSTRTSAGLPQNPPPVVQASVEQAPVVQETPALLSLGGLVPGSAFECPSFVQIGESLRLTGDGFVPSGLIDAVISSPDGMFPEMSLGSFLADSAGVVEFTVAIPPGFPDGSMFGIRASGTGSEGETRILSLIGDAFTVEPPCTGTDDVSSLPGETTIVDVVANDSPGAAALDLSTLTVDVDPMFGVAIVDGASGKIEYTAAPDWLGEDRFLYRVCNTNGNCALGEVTVDVDVVCTIVGTEGDDLLVGTDGDDVICGLGGRDQIDARKGNDIIIGGLGADHILAGPGDDYVVAGEGDDIVDAGSGSDTVYGGEGIDVIAGRQGEDVIVGGDGDDSIKGGAGADDISGGLGDDTIFGNSGTDTISGGDGDDTLFGGRDADVIAGGDGVDAISGGAGDDVVDAGAGDDSVEGKNGDDVIVGGLGDDSIKGGKGNDSLSGGAGDDTISGNSGTDTISGGDGDDTLLGGRDADTIDGGAGTDTISGGAGDDVIDAGAGDDSVEGKNGNDTIVGGVGNDSIKGGKGTDDLSGDAGEDTIYGNSGDDTISGGVGDDTLAGGRNADTIDGGDGIDTISGGAGDDVIDAGAGDDTVEGKNGNDTIIGGPGNDSLKGNGGDDVVSGDGGDDTLVGGGGDDVLDGGLGSDVADGGGGTDQCTAEVTIRCE